MEELGIIMPVVELHVKFIRPAHYDDLLSVKTILRELPTDHRIDFHQEVYNEAGKLLATGKVVLYFMQATSMKKSTMPDELLQKLKIYFQ
jgi:acyl-CoA thioester hydrolase